MTLSSTAPVASAQPFAPTVHTDDREWIDVLDDAIQHGAIYPAQADNVKVRAAIGLLSPEGVRSEVTRLLADGNAPSMALDAIASAFCPGDVLEVRALDPFGRGELSLSVSGRLDVQEERAKLLAHIRANIGRRNIYFGINPRRAELAGTDRAGSALDTIARRNIVLDLDRKDAPPSDPGWTRTIEALKALDPILVQDTGNGFQVMLPIADIEGADLPASVGPLAAVTARIGADNMADLPRIVRLPLTVNLPTDSKRKRGNVVRLAAPMPGTAPPAPRGKHSKPTLDACCAALDDIATRLGLPGRAAAGKTPAASRISSGGEEKTGWAASAEVLRILLGELPNDQGHFDDRAAFLAVLHAIKGAAIAGNCEAEARDLALRWAARWSRGGDPVHNAQAYDGIRNPHTGRGTLMQTLERVNPAGHTLVKEFIAQTAFAQEAAQNVQALSSPKIGPVQPFTPSALPPRQWLYSTTAIAGFITMLVAPGGAGKSALAMVWAVAMATGRELLPDEKPRRQLTVWVHNAEDSDDEQKRRLAATMQHHGVQHADLGGRLILTSGRELKLRLARMGRDGPEIIPGVVDWLTDMMLKMRVKVLMLDPLGAMHGIPENSNEAANLLAGAIREIADRTGAAIIILHHAGKLAAMDMDAAGVGASRGASAFTDAARVVRQIVRMPPKEATRFGISESERRAFFRVENGKDNMARAEDARWLRMRPVKLGNITPEYPDGDEVATVERWTPPTAMPGTASELAQTQAAIAAAATLPRKDEKSPEWVGYVAAQALGLDIGAPGGRTKDLPPAQAQARARVRTMMNAWLRNGGLVVIEGKGKNRHAVDCIGVGVPADFVADSDDHASPNPDSQ